MPTEVEIVPTGKAGRVIVLRYTDGKPDGVGDRIDPLSRTARSRMAKAVGVEEPVLAHWLTQPGRHTVPTTGPDPDTFLTRRATQSDAEAITHTDWLVALRELPKDHLLVWSDKAALCCLDVDYHSPSTPPDKSWLEGIVLARLVPRPRAWHFSKGGGLHLFYERSDPFTGEELAAIAALRYRTIDPTAGVELKRQVWGPGQNDLYVAPMQDTAGALSEWIGVDTFDQGKVAEWISEAGVQPGGRYDHTKCPINPTPGYESTGEPVTIGDRGIFCHRCDGMGLSLGSRKPGFAPWAAILGAPSSGDVGRMVRNLTHWGHARYLFTARYGMPEWLARKAYAAACKAYHHGKPSAALVPGVFHTDTADFTRVNNNWMSLEQSYLYAREGLRDILAQLPAAQVYDEMKEQVRVSSSTVSELSQGKDLTDRGYPNVEVIHGFKFADTFMPPEDKTVVAVVCPAITAAGMAYAPRYGKNMTEEDAWTTIERLMPGIDRSLVKVVLCALGTAQETHAGMHPFVFVTGPSGAAKTTTIRVGAAIAGVKTADVVFDADTTRFRESIGMAAGSSAVILVNEVLKDAERAHRRLSPRQALEPILGLTPGSYSRVAYKGAVRLDRVPVTFFTEPELPLHMREETQIARRLRHRRLHGRKDVWKQTLSAAGVRPDDMHLLRLVSPEVASACNAILTAVVDEFFTEPMTFDQMADKLGVPTVEDSPDFDDPAPFLRDFFRHVCLAPEIEHERLRKMYAHGYKRISRADGVSSESDADHLITLYTMFADGPGVDWVKSQKLAAADWSGLLKTDVPVWFDHKTDGSAVYVRFRAGPLKTPAAVNQQIVNPSQWVEEV